MKLISLVIIDFIIFKLYSISPYLYELQTTPYPIDQISTLYEYSALPSNTSGAL
jgi:hypothetical protein